MGTGWFLATSTFCQKPFLQRSGNKWALSALVSAAQKHSPPFWLSCRFYPQLSWKVQTPEKAGLMTEETKGAVDEQSAAVQLWC